MNQPPSSSLRICMLVSSHTPDDDRIYHKEAKSLARAGFEVWIVSPDPDRIPQDEEGVRFASFPRRGGLLGRITALVWLLRLGKRCNADVYHCHEPESLLAALILKAVLRRKMVFDSHELWGAVFAERFPRWAWGITTRIYQALERVLVRRCEGAIGATRAITEYLEMVCGSKKAITLLNVPMVQIFRMPAGSRSVGRVTICHDGYLTFDRGLKVIVGAVRRLSISHDVVFKIIGEVFDHERIWLERYVEEHHLGGVIHRTGWLPYAQVGEMLSSCDIGIVALTRLPNHIDAAPNKLFNYMFYGLPVIGPSFMSVLVQLEHEEQCCLTTNCDSEEELAKTLEALIDDRERLRQMGENARRVSREKYRWEHMEPKLVSLYRELFDMDRPD